MANKPIKMHPIKQIIRLWSTGLRVILVSNLLPIYVASVALMTREYAQGLWKWEEPSMKEEESAVVDTEE